ncbi:MAG: hypothetical protein WDN31_21085 [Hyphomicrobium sp.]
MSCYRRAALIAIALACATLAAQGAELRPFGRDSWKDMLAAAKGEPVIVHFWGLSCSICLAELPEWGAFAARHPRTRLVLINWDRQPQDLKRIDATLEKSDLAGAENWVLGDEFEEKVRFNTDRAWIGELPRTRLIAADGTLTVFSGSADFAQLDDWLRQQHGGAPARP